MDTWYDHYKEAKMATTTLYFVTFLLFAVDSSHAWTNKILPIAKYTRVGHSSRCTSPSHLRRSSSFSDNIEYTVQLGLPPIGIVFEEVEPIGYSGVQVTGLVPGGKGDQCKKIQVGDRLKSTTAIKFMSGSSNFEVVAVDCRSLDFDTIVSAIGSNQEKFRVDRVELTFVRPAVEGKESSS